MKPKLLDLFAGAGTKKRDRLDRDYLRDMRSRLSIPAKDSPILLAPLCESFRLAGPEQEELPPLRFAVRTEECRRCQPTALLPAVCQEPQRKADSCLEHCQSRKGQGIPQESIDQRSGERAQEIGRAPKEDPRPSRRGMLRVWRHQSILAARRLHPHKPGDPLSASTSFCVCSQAPRAIPDPLRESSLRADPYGPYRGNRYPAIARSK